MTCFFFFFWGGGGVVGCENCCGAFSPGFVCVCACVSLLASPHMLRGLRDLQLRCAQFTPEAWNVERTCFDFRGLCWIGNKGQPPLGEFRKFETIPSCHVETHSFWASFPESKSQGSSSLLLSPERELVLMTEERAEHSNRSKPCGKELLTHVNV